MNSRDTQTKRSEYESRARECVQALHGLITEAKREGYSVEVFTSMDIGGEPQSRVTVVLR